MDLKTNLDKAMNKIVSIGNQLADAQEKFVQSHLYEIFNVALDAGIKATVPSIADDALIDIKNSILENGMTDGIKEIWNNIKEYGKTAFGIVSGKFDSIEQVQMATKTGGVLDTVSKIFDFALDKAVDKGEISKSTRQSLKTKKNSIIKNIKSEISEELDNQVKYIEKINEYNMKWQECFKNEDLSGMKNANRNIQKYLEKTLPLEETLKQARKVEIIQTLVESTR